MANAKSTKQKNAGTTGNAKKQTASKKEKSANSLPADYAQTVLNQLVEAQKRGLKTLRGKTRCWLKPSRKCLKWGKTRRRRLCRIGLNKESKALSKRRNAGRKSPSNEWANFASRSLKRRFFKLQPKINRKKRESRHRIARQNARRVARFRHPAKRPDHQRDERQLKDWRFVAGGSLSGFRAASRQ